MTTSLKPYPAMKDPRLPWLGEVPAHWTVVRSKRLFTPRTEFARADDVQLSATQAFGVIPQSEFERVVGRKVVRIVQHLDKRRHVEVGDFVISMRSFQGGLERAWATGCIRSSYVVLRASTRDVNVDYYASLFKSDGYIRALQSTANFIRDGQDLNFENFCSVDLPFPPPDEQATIGRFLRYTQRQIGRYIRAKQKLIALLDEQRQAIIHRAVTRGRDPNVRLKPSAVEWLGDVPEHWDVKRLKWATRLQRGYDLPAERRIPGAYPVVSSGGIIGTHHEARAQGPGVVMGRYGSTDAVFFVEPDFWPHNTALFVTDFQGNRPRWCYFMLRAISKADHSGKSAVPGVDRKDLFDITVAVPPVGEQDDIVEWIDRHLARLERAIGAAQRGIGLLREHRTRLIADVVTGKLDVREAAAQLPQELAEVPDEDESLVEEAAAEADDSEVAAEAEVI